MYKIMLSSLLMLFALTTVLAQDGTYAFITSNNLRLRSTPSSDGKVITTLPEGTFITVYMSNPSKNQVTAEYKTGTITAPFYQIECKQGKGWVHGGGFAEANIYIVQTNGLRMHTEANVDSKTVASLKKGDVLYGPGKSCEEMITVKINGEDKTDYLYFVQNMSGSLKGWVFGGGMEEMPKGD